ncbi:hypothetical protein FEM48_Zijuj03G0108400 [Ziziphus jujuba var. spinosa]|uniref:RING-type domain-containing protein n=1 Tax=Ziziphus jujuba var. spinosa TaxID=714518 RepID=A0A978VPV9_ZIZJJ|nr:hypothetical protein FEM48_Zijuj03G0108400 [Ziziphus jujuba var. spinosa]
MLIIIVPAFLIILYVTCMVRQAIESYNAIKSLPVVLHQSLLSSRSDGGGGGEQSDRCIICLVVFGEGDEVKILPSCNHYFHPHCADKWLKHKPSCPLCRSLLKEIIVQ